MLNESLKNVLAKDVIEQSRAAEQAKPNRKADGRGTAEFTDEVKRLIRADEERTAKSRRAADETPRPAELQKPNRRNANAKPAAKNAGGAESRAATDRNIGNNNNNETRKHIAVSETASGKTAAVSKYAAAKPAAKEPKAAETDSAHAAQYLPANEAFAAIPAAPAPLSIEGAALEVRNSQASELISAALAKISSMLNLPSSVSFDEESLIRFDQESLEQFAEILHALESIGNLLDNVAEGGEDLDADGVNISADEAAILSADLRVEKFHVQMGLSMIGAREIVSDIMAEKTDAQLPASGISQAADPASLGMSTVDTARVFGSLTAEDLTAAIERIKLAKNGQPANADAQDTKQEPAAADSQEMRAMFKAAAINVKTENVNADNVKAEKVGINNAVKVGINNVKVDSENVDNVKAERVGINNVIKVGINGIEVDNVKVDNVKAERVGINDAVKVGINDVKVDSENVDNVKAEKVGINNAAKVGINDAEIDNVKVDNIKPDGVDINNIKAEKVGINNVIKVGINGIEVDNVKVDNVKAERVGINNVEIDNVTVDNIKAEKVGINDGVKVGINDVETDNVTVDNIKPDGVDINNIKAEKVGINNADKVGINNVETDNVTVDNVRAEKAGINNVKIDNENADDVKPENVKVDNENADEIKPEQVKPENVKVKAEDVKSERVKVENVKTQDVKDVDAEPEHVETDVAKTEYVAVESAREEQGKPKNGKPETAKAKDAKTETENVKAGPETSKVFGGINIPLSVSELANAKAREANAALEAKFAAGFAGVSAANEQAAESAKSDKGAFTLGFAPQENSSAVSESEGVEPQADIVQADAAQAKAQAAVERAEKVSTAFSRVDNEALIRQITEKMHHAIRNGVQEVRMVLRPEALGEVRMSLRVEGDVVFARIQVENSQVKAVVESQLQNLKDSLEQQNLHAGAFSVDVGSGGERSPREAWQELAEAARQSKFREGGVERVGASEADAVGSAAGSDTGRRFGNNTFELFI